MRTTIVLLSAIAILLVGCDQLPWVKKPEPVKPGPNPPAKKTDFEGHYLTVTMNGNQTQLGPKATEGQTWTAPAISGKLVVNYQHDEAHLGAQNQADVQANPIKANGMVHHTNIYKTRIELTPGADITIDKWEFYDNKNAPKMHDVLPPGKYSIKVRVNGENTWDVQDIRVTVK